MSKISSKTAIKIPSVAEDRAIRAAARADLDAQPLTPKQLSKMVPLKTLRGRPRSAQKKVLVSIRYSQEVLSHFKAMGDGWQTQMDGVLRQYVASQTSTSQKCTVV